MMTDYQQQPRWRRILEHRAVVWPLSLLLGGVFLYAAYDKLLDPRRFADVIHNYRLLPDPAVNVVALLLPMAEAVCGVLVVTGVKRTAAAAVLNGMLLVFIAALTINLARGH